MSNRKFSNLEGKRFGALLVLEEFGRGPSGDVLWKCLCDCGNIVTNKTTSNLPKTKKCGSYCKTAWDSLESYEDFSTDSEPYGVVYRLTNSINNKIYIGQSVFGLEDRWKKHVEYANQGGEGYLQNAIRCYGKDSFTRKVIDTAYSKIHLDYLEKKYISEFKSYDSSVGYNLKWNAPRGLQGNKKTSEKQLGSLNHYYRHDIVEEEIAALYLSGLSVEEIAKKYKASRGLISYRLKNHGIEVKSFAKKINTENRPRTEVETNSLVKEYEAGLSTRQLAKKYNVGVTTVKRRLHSANVIMRPAPTFKVENNSNLPPDRGREPAQAIPQSAALVG